MTIRKFLIGSLMVLSAAVFANDYVVTSTDDSGPGTLREALGLAVTGDSITFNGALSGTITLASDLDDIDADIVINGNGNVTIDGDSSYKAFRVTGFTTINNLKLANTDGSREGSAMAISGTGYLTLDTVELPHCTTGCLAPLKLEVNGTLFSNDLTFTSANSSGVDVMFSDGSLAMMGATNLEPQMWVDTSGIGVLYIEGSGTINVNTASSCDLNLVVDEGTLNFSGTVIEPIYVLENGTFQGTPICFYLNTIGVTRTGDALGTITGTDGYFQENTGIVYLKIDADGNNDMIAASDDMIAAHNNGAQLSGTLIIPLSPGTYEALTNYTLITTNVGFTGAFDHAYFDIPGAGLEPITNATLTYNTNSLDLTITSTFVIEEEGLRAMNSRQSKESKHDVSHLRKKAHPSRANKIFTSVMKGKGPCGLPCEERCFLLSSPKY